VVSEEAVEADVVVCKEATSSRAPTNNPNNRVANLADSHSKHNSSTKTKRRGNSRPTRGRRRLTLRGDDLAVDAGAGGDGEVGAGDAEALVVISTTITEAECPTKDSHPRRAESPRRDHPNNNNREDSHHNREDTHHNRGDSHHNKAAVGSVGAVGAVVDVGAAGVVVDSAADLMVLLRTHNNFTPPLFYPPKPSSSLLLLECT